MKFAVAQDLANQSAAILSWLNDGETIVLMQNGEPLGRIIPEKISAPTRHEIFARRFAPLAKVPNRDLTEIVSENRGES